MIDRPRNGMFLRAKQDSGRVLTPEEVAEEQRKNDADSIALKYLETSPTDPASPKDAEENSRAWDKAQNDNPDEVREYLLHPDFATQSDADRQAYVLRWREIRGL